MSEILIAIIIGLLLAFFSILYRKQKEIKRVQQAHFALKNENKILLQQLMLIREDKAYEGVHLKEVQQAFDDLDKSIVKLRAVCKIKSHGIDKKLDKWQGKIPSDDSSDLGTSQIKISFNTSSVVRKSTENK